MKSQHHRNRWLFAGALTVLLALVASRLTEPEPRFEGRRLSDWLDDPGLSEAQITRGVRAIGTNALPQFQVWLTARPSVFERIVRQIDRPIDHIGISYHPSLDANFRAMRGFLALGELAAPAVPWLEAGVRRQDDDFEFYLKALLAAGPAGWEAFRRIEEPARTGNLDAFFSALRFGVVTSPELVRWLEEYLAHPDALVRRAAYLHSLLLRESSPASLRAALLQRVNDEPDGTLRALLQPWATRLAPAAGEGPADQPLP